jgi:hypothetical protein
MKKYLYLFIAVFGYCSTFAQPQDKKFERIEALRVQFISNELQLTVEEAKVFWPLYNEFKAAEKEIQGDRFDRQRRKDPDKKNLDNMSDEEIDQLVKEELQRQRALIDLREKYYSKFKAVLPVKKAAKLFKAEHDFNRRLLRELRDRGGKNKP